MPALDYRTAGESHGRALTVLVEGLPAGLVVDTGRINHELRRRQGGYGRGGRQRIEQDAVEILSGVRQGRTIGSPLVMQIVNRDFRIDDAPAIHRPRPGHADLAGALKWLTTDCRNALERASARETAARTAAGALAACLLAEFGMRSVGFVVQIGSARAAVPDDATPDELIAARDANSVYTPDARAVEPMVGQIQQAAKNKDTVGGIVEVRVFGTPPGLGSSLRWQDKLDGRLMQAVGSIQAIKGVEIGLGFGVAGRPGSQVHDPIHFDRRRRHEPHAGFVRPTNRAGGIEGGMTNGMPVIVRAAMKPISTLLRGMDSVDLTTGHPQRSDYERSDICAVAACSVVAENVVAFEIARALCAKFAGDTLDELKAAWRYYWNEIRRRTAGG